MDIITRKEAIELGLKKYYTGKMCKHGHLSERNTKTRKCYECDNIVSKLNYDYKSKKAYDKKYRLINKENIARRNRIYQETHREAIRAYNKKWHKSNPESSVLRKMKRKFSEGLATTLWYETDLIKQIYLKRDELSKLWGIQLHVDHVVPLQGKNVCGLHCWDNLQLLEADLNLSKHSNFEG